MSYKYHVNVFKLHSLSQKTNANYKPLDITFTFDNFEPALKEYISQVTQAAEFYSMPVNGEFNKIRVTLKDTEREKTMTVFEATAVSADED